MEFRVLGPLEVAGDDGTLELGGVKQRSLLAMLLLHAGEAVSKDRLVDTLWGASPPLTAGKTVQVYVSRLRKTLADDRLVTRAPGYVLYLEPGELDLARFEALLAEARDAPPETAVKTLDEALALWRGPPLADLAYEQFAQPVVARLDEMRIGAVEQRLEANLALGRHADLVPELETLVAQHPLREHFRHQLMLALYRCDRQADALDAYRRARQELTEELGLEPSESLKRLEAAILRQDPELATSPLAPAAAPPPRRGRPPLLAAAMALLAVLVVGAVTLALREEPPRAAQAPRVVVGPDYLVEIDPSTNRVASAIRVGSKPDSIAATREALWVANVGDRTVSRVDRATGEVRVVGGTPVAFQLEATLSGEVWVSSFEEPVVTLIARRGEVIEDVQSLAGAPRVVLPGSGEGMAIGGGYLWVTSPGDSGGGNTVFQIDLRTRRLVASIPVGTLPAFTAFGYGSAWISNYRGASVSVVRPGSKEAETVAVAEGPLGIAAGEGAVWVVSFWSRSLSRIDPETRRVVARIPVGDGPLGVAAGAGGVWVTNRDDRTVSRIDPRTNRVAATIRLAASPWGIHVAHGRVWVTTQRCGSPVEHC